MTRTGHTARQNQLCVITRHHIVTLNMVNGLVIDILYIKYYTRKLRVEGHALQEHKYCKEGITGSNLNAGDESMLSVAFIN